MMRIKALVPDTYYTHTATCIVIPTTPLPLAFYTAAAIEKKALHHKKLVFHWL